MLLSEVRDFLKTKIDCPQWCINSLLAGKEQAICLYGIQGPKRNIAIGGLQNNSYATKAVSRLIHWGNSPDIAERKAQEVFNAIFGQDAVIVIQFDMRTSEPISVGTDSNGIYEYVIETVIYYER